MQENAKTNNEKEETQIKQPEAQEKGESSVQPTTTASSSSSSDESKLTAGEIIKLVRVRFPGNAKSFPFLIGKRKFMYGQKVMAMSDRGMTLGYINSVPYEVPFDKSMLPLKSISKVATDEDVHEQRSYYLKEKEAENFCKNLIETHKLDMNLTHVEFIQFGKKAVFYFNAPARVDFRNLVKDLVADLKMRIELRQISVRDRAAAIGAIGVCGLQTCCSSFLKNYGNVSIKMAKNQNLALIPSKINGICGQIKCCIKYEDDVYSQKRTLLPKEGIFLKAKNGDIGRVQKLHLLVEQFDMITEKGQIRRYSVNQFVKDDCKPPKDWKFPNDLRHIVNETSTVIGLTDEEQRKSEEFLKKYSEENGDSVVEVFVDDSDDDNSLEELNSLEGEIQVKTEKKNKRPQNKRPNNRNRNNPKQNNEKKASSADDNTSKPPQKKKYRPKKKKPFKKPE
ncbi:stage 0 sporulation family protein [Halobacteriovorax sp.]|uniref:PSP1 domain-containing protein n=1 Tax=Halobacteriovorax sp. TaxID=2020862 RepID=UPI0035695582